MHQFKIGASSEDGRSAPLEAPAEKGYDAEDVNYAAALLLILAAGLLFLLEGSQQRRVVPATQRVEVLLLAAAPGLRPRITIPLLQVFRL